jgi:hypothetical protein
VVQSPLFIYYYRTMYQSIHGCYLNKILIMPASCEVGQRDNHSADHPRPRGGGARRICQGQRVK